MDCAQTRQQAGSLQQFLIDAAEVKSPHISVCFAILSVMADVCATELIVSGRAPPHYEIHGTKMSFMKSF